MAQESLREKMARKKAERAASQQPASKAPAAVAHAADAMPVQGTAPQYGVPTVAPAVVETNLGPASATPLQQSTPASSTPPAVPINPPEGTHHVTPAPAAGMSMKERMLARRAAQQPAAAAPPPQPAAVQEAYAPPPPPPAAQPAVNPMHVQQAPPPAQAPFVPAPPKSIGVLYVDCAPLHTEGEPLVSLAALMTEAHGMTLPEYLDGGPLPRETGVTVSMRTPEGQAVYELLAARSQRVIRGF